MFQLTDCDMVNYGYPTYIDTFTGEALQLREWDWSEPERQVCGIFEGPRRPIDEVLGEWINNFLSLKWTSYGSEDIITDKHRTMVWHSPSTLQRESVLFQNF